MADAPGGGQWSGRDGLLELRSRLHAWAASRDGILGVLAFGSTERADRPADDWSDLDLMLLVPDAAPWLADLAWTEEVGPSWLRFVHPAPIPGLSVVQVLFAGGYDVDLVPLDDAGLDVLRDPAVAGDVMGAGARVVRDDDGRLTPVAAAAAAPAPIPLPDRETWDHVTRTFLYQGPWATKRLMRGERWRAWDDTAGYMRHRLLRMLEWQAVARGQPGVYPESRKLETWLPPDVAARLPATFAGYDDAQMAAALPELMALFGDAAREVAAATGFPYPEDADREIRAWMAARLAGFPAE